MMHLPILCLTSDSHRGLSFAIAGVSVDAYRLYPSKHRGGLEIDRIETDAVALDGIKALMSCSCDLQCSS